MYWLLSQYGCAYKFFQSRHFKFFEEKQLELCQSLLVANGIYKVWEDQAPLGGYSRPDGDEEDDRAVVCWR